MKPRSLFPLFLLAVALPIALPGGASSGYSVKVRGGDEASFTPAAPKSSLSEDPVLYDAVIVGGGLGGLSAGLYLSDAGKRVLLLEKEEAVGGLAFGGALPRGGGHYNRGAAYWTSAYDEESKILERLGMADYKNLHAIHEPIDSYLWKGRFYEHLWDEHTLEKLPASFALFKHELKLADKAKMIPNQPIEESGAVGLDMMSGAEWIRLMPEMTRMRQDLESKRIYKRFLSDPAVGRVDPMEAVVDYMDVFCPSALGATVDKLSAVAFANFYISEIETRYTTPIGTGESVAKLESLLRARPQLATLLTSATALKIKVEPESAVVVYSHHGRRVSARGRFVVYAAQLKFAPKLIEGFAEGDPERASLLGAMEYANFSVHNVFVKGHPFRASFDTWVRTPDRKEGDYTDVIIGRWMDPKIRGYEGMRDFKKHPSDDQGVLSIYHPHPLSFAGSGYTKEQSERSAREAVEGMLADFNPLLKEHWGTSIDVRSVETNRWPFSIHIAKPGHFTVLARVLRRPYGRVFFANNNIGTPSFEEALFRGHCAANNILKRLDSGFIQEPWTRCPLEN